MSPTPPNDARPSVSSGKDRSDGAASGHGHGRRKPWTAPHLTTISTADFRGSPLNDNSIQDGVTCYSPG